jgi:hypothetical protein
VAARAGTTSAEKPIGLMPSGDPPGLPGPGRGGRPEQHREPLLDRLGVHLGGGDAVEPALELDRVRAPAGPHGRDHLVHAGADPVHGHVGGLELLGHPALAQPGYRPPAAELVEGGEAAGQHHRRVQQSVDHAGAQPDPLGLAGHVAERLQRLVGQPVLLGDPPRGPVGGWQLGQRRSSRS